MSKDPLTRDNRKFTISSRLFPNHRSGLSNKEVSPCKGGVNGPIFTLGYPMCPTKIDGGVAPEKFFVESFL